MFRGTRQDLEEIESITPTAPGVAIAVVRWLHGAYTTPSGNQVQSQNTRMTLVLAKGEGGWKIVQGCNIEVDAQAARFDPIRGQKPG
jgi:ketosteroid isomerase-like protein